MIYSKRENAVSSKWPQLLIFVSRPVRKWSQRNLCANESANLNA
jgi:hypothetical protein